jgi:hypothetical protein
VNSSASRNIRTREVKQNASTWHWRDEGWMRDHCSKFHVSAAAAPNYKSIRPSCTASRMGIVVVLSDSVEYRLLCSYTHE